MPLYASHRDVKFWELNEVVWVSQYWHRCSAPCRHSDSKVALKEKSFSASENDMADVYPLQLKLSVSRETNSLGIKISKKVIHLLLICRTFIVFLICETL